MSSPANDYRPEIDGLRAFAVLLVIAYHIDESIVPNGFLGVDLFFVISGYVVSASLSTRLEQVRLRVLWEFYARRVKRLLPALLTCAVATGLATAMFVHHPRQGLITGASALFGASGVALWFKGKDYFAAGQQLNTFTHTWSLGVEEQFYLVFPWLMFAAKALRRDFTVWLGAVVVLSLAGYLWIAPGHPSAAFYFMPFRMWELGIGGLVWSMGQKHAHRSAEAAASPTPMRFWVAQASFVLSVGIVPFLPIADWSRLTVTAAGFFALSLHLLATPGPARELLCRPSLVYIGKLSYSLYLWHWVVLTIALNIFGVERPTWTLLPIMVMFAVASYHLVEKPLRRAQWFGDDGAHPLKVISTGLGFSVGCAALLMLFVHLHPKLFLGDPRYLGLRSFLLESPCHLTRGEEDVTDCLRRTGDGPTIYLLGDSHAGNLWFGLRDAAQGHGYRFASLTDLSFTYDPAHSEVCDEPACSGGDLIERFDFLRRELQPGDHVVFSLARERVYGSDASFSFARVANPTIISVLRHRLRRLAQITVSRGGQLIIVDDIPKVCSEIEYAAAAFQSSACQTDVAQSLADREPLSELYRELRNEVQGVVIIDPHSLFCEGNRCSNFLGDELLYVDASPHLTESASRRTSDFFLRKLSPAPR